MSVSPKDMQQYKTLQLYPLLGCNYTNSFRSLNVAIITHLLISSQTCRLPSKRSEFLGELNWNKNSKTASMQSSRAELCSSQPSSQFTSTAGGCVWRISCHRILSVDLNPQRRKSWFIPVIFQKNRNHLADTSGHVWQEFTNTDSVLITVWVLLSGPI